MRVAPSVTAVVSRTVRVGVQVAAMCQAVGSRFGEGPRAENRTWVRLVDGTFVHDLLVTTVSNGPRMYPVSGGGYVRFDPRLPQCGAAVVAGQPELRASPADGAHPSAVAFPLLWSAGNLAPVPKATAQAMGRAAAAKRGWGDSQFACLDRLWTRESQWDFRALNRSSGAFGIPQALPATKMASAGADWLTNPATQISWGLSYIAGRYSTPCRAWAHSQAVGWY